MAAEATAERHHVHVEQTTMVAAAVVPPYYRFERSAQILLLAAEAVRLVED